MRDRVAGSVPDVTYDCELRHEQLKILNRSVYELLTVVNIALRGAKK